MFVPTNPDSGAGWINDEPTHLRVRGTEVRYALPENGEGAIGAAEGCWLQLLDPSGRVSRQHARVVRNQELNRWVISDLRSRNGLLLDGTRQVTSSLAPGGEIGIGGLTLIVESPRLVAVRDLLCRVLGWGATRGLEVDLALRAVRFAATRREALQLCGQGDTSLAAIARLLHVCTLGDARPFAFVGRRMPSVEPEDWATFDGHARYERGTEAVGAVTDGTLCVWPRRPPVDFDQVLALHRDPSSRFALIMCASKADPLIASRVEIPPLQERADELTRIIDAFAADVAPPGSLRAADRDWIAALESKSFAKIQIAVRRVLAIRALGITKAAQQLGMAHGSLSDWFSRSPRVVLSASLQSGSTHAPDDDD